MSEDKYLKPELDETKVFYCWRLHRNGYNKDSIIKALKSDNFFDSAPSDTPEDIYRSFLDDGLDLLKRAKLQRPSRTRYAFVIWISKYLHITREQAEGWVQLYEHTGLKENIVWPAEKHLP